jgi:predicted transcriptional regulator
MALSNDKKRGIRRSTAVAFSALLVLGVLAGFVNATSGTDLPKSFGVASPQIGDRATYEYLRMDPGADGHPDVGQRTPYTILEWLPSGEIYDAHGTSHHVHRLASQPQWMPTMPKQSGRSESTNQWSQIQSIDSTTHEGIAQTLGDDGRMWLNQSLPFGLLPSSDEVHIGMDITMYLPDEAAGLGVVAPVCGLFNDLQGAVHSLDTPVRQSENCMMLNPISKMSEKFDIKSMADQFHFVSKGAVWTPIRQEQLGSRTTVVFAAPGALGTAVYLWLAGDVPYPVQIAFPGPDTASPIHVFRLTEFRAGTGPLKSAAPIRPAVPAIERGPSKRLGMDDSARTDPFRLVDAVRKATEDPRSPFARVMAGPESYLLAASYMEWASSNQGTSNRSWSLQATDGHDVVSVVLFQEHGPPKGLGVLHGFVPDETRYGYDNRSKQVAGHGLSPFANFADVPLVPTFESLERSWKAYTGDSGAPNLLQFERGCQDVACRNVTSMTQIGRTEFVQKNDPVMSAAKGKTSSLSISAFILADLGRVSPKSLPIVMNHHQEETWSRQPVAGQEIVPESAQVRPMAAAPAWSMPTPPTVVKLSAVAILLGLVAYAWPWLRGIPVAGLFTRVQGPKLLEHAARQDIVSTIEQRPGIHFMELSRSTHLGHGALDHHLRLLVKGDLILEVHSHGYKCYVLKGAHDHRAVRGLPALKSDGSKAILDLVRRSPGLRPTAIAQQAGISPPSVTYHVRRLEEAGLIRRETDGTSVKLFATEQAAAAHALAVAA